jgi:hypothetical protein
MRAQNLAPPKILSLMELISMKSRSLGTLLDLDEFFLISPVVL